LIAAGKAHDDEPWRLPLPDGYREWLNSDIADTNNAHGNAFAGASIAGLFLDRFVGEGLDWAHFDTFAWRPQPSRAGPRVAMPMACAPPGTCCATVSAGPEPSKLA
jgi:leucyl aminopeptidase